MTADFAALLYLVAGLDNPRSARMNRTPETR